MTQGDSGATTDSTGTATPKRRPLPRHRTLFATLIATCVVLGAGIPTLVGKHSNSTAAQQLERSLATYYQELPGHLAAAWADVTPRYRAYLGGMAGFQAFWRPYDRVTLTGPDVQLPDSVYVTVAYHRKTGGYEVEKTGFVLVKQGDRWLIDASAVLSHHEQAG